ncbi:ribonuclease P protein component [Planctomicrobium piriforme]|uniref:Ribonuclease P protein component n=1 Tax=Planctomicrobium piriforme TaxID=1576369 RepID=A0A1I3L676_9PLAN|nr:ribonuclease P protein component [Planctomicrobium piriforme]SFI79935.1 ribonuclease P protein component [Planctomicrobium piriforme]
MNAQNEEHSPLAETPRLTFPPHFRIRSSLDFERIYAQKARFSDPVMLIFAAPNDLPHPRIGLSVSRRHGNSVKRHRLRRLLREAFRLEQHHLPVGIDFILIPGRETATATQADYRRSLVKLAQRAAERWR